MSEYWVSVQATPEKFENAASFHGPTVHTSPSLKRSFTKTLIEPEEFETPDFRFRVDGKHFDNGTFLKRWLHVTFPDRVFLRNISKMTGDCCVFKFLRRSVDGKHLMRFRSETENSSHVKQIKGIERKGTIL